MPPDAPSSGMPVTLRLSEQARRKLTQLSEQNGIDVDSVASDLIERAVTKPTADELLAPYRQQVKDSGTSDDELDAFHRELLSKVRQEKKAKSA